MAQYTSRKAQIFSFEAIVSIMIFTIVFIFFGKTVFAKITEINEISEANLLRDKLFAASDTLLRTKGVPYDWNESNYVRIGLEEEDFLISQKKLNMLLSLSENEVLDNLDLNGYHIFINISNIYPYTENISYTFGTLPNNVYILSRVYRFFLLKNESIRIPMKMEMEVWR